MTLYFAIFTDVYMRHRFVALNWIVFLVKEFNSCVGAHDFSLACQLLH